MRRYLHSFPEAPQLAGRNIIQAMPSVDPRVPQTPNFKVLSLGSLLQVQLPPSVELLAKRNALAGILGAGAPAASLSSRLKISRSPLLSLWARQPVLQQSIIGTSPLTCLVASTKNEFLSAVELDGTLDWVVKSPINAYTGRQLRLSPRTGWRPGSAPFAHTIASGRGWICFGSPASTVQVCLSQGESVLVAKHHLNAYTVDTNASHKTPTLENLNFQFGSLSQPKDLREYIPEDPNTRTSNGITSALTTVWNKTWSLLSIFKQRLDKIFRSGNSTQFVEIHGPTTIILSASARPARLSSSQDLEQKEQKVTE